MPILTKSYLIFINFIRAIRAASICLIQILRLQIFSGIVQVSLFYSNNFRQQQLRMQSVYKSTMDRKTIKVESSAQQIEGCKGQELVLPKIETKHKINFSDFEKSGRQMENRPIQKKYRANLEVWELQEIQKVFALYEEIGSKWIKISERFKERPYNSIKNRFYTVIRNLLKALFYGHPELPEKIPHEISSKIILKFYQGRQQFSKSTKLGKELLKDIDYDLESSQIPKFITQHQNEIKKIYELIFGAIKENEEQISGQNQNIKAIQGVYEQCQQIQSPKIKQDQVAQTNISYSHMQQPTYSSSNINPPYFGYYLMQNYMPTTPSFIYYPSIMYNMQQQQNPQYKRYIREQ